MKRNPLHHLTACLSSLIALSPLSAHAEDRPLWLRDPAISPDGAQIAFTYGGQIWRVASSGGEATPLTTSNFYASKPIWSPDSSKIAFASTRHGNDDVFIMPATGGDITRLTFHSAADIPTSFSADGSSIYFDSKRLGDPKVHFGGNPRSAASQLYAVPTEGGRERLVVPLPCQETSPSKDGRFFLYTNLPGGENPWRKHEVSAMSRDIWVYNTEDKSHRQITFEAENDREPVWSEQAGVLYYLSEHKGSQNIWRRSFKGKDAPVQVTQHDTHPVRFLTCSNTGDLVYGYDGEIWKLAKGETEPKRVPITISQSSMLDGSYFSNVSKYITEFVLSADGKQAAIIARGEVFVVDPMSGRSRRITTTPEHESNVSFSPDGTRLLYISHRDGNWDAYETSLASKDATSFLTPGALKESPIIATDSDVLSPAYSPDGKSIAYQEDYSRIKVYHRETKQTTTAVKDGILFSYTVDDLPFSWSPDGRFLAVTTGSSGGNQEIQLADPTGKSEPLNITQSGFYESNPQFSDDGKAVFYLSSRSGLTSADSKPAQADVYVTYLTQEAFDARNQPAAKPAEGEKSEPWQPELDGIEQRALRVSPFSSPVTVYQRLANDTVLWPTVLPTGLSVFRTGVGGAGLAPLFNYTKDPNALVVSPDQKWCYIAHSNGIDRIQIPNGAATPLPIDLEIDYDPRGEMQYLFDYFWRTTKIKFYRKDMHGVDWDLYKKEYAKYLPHISRWEDFAILLSELSGELNASHMGGYYQNPPSYGDATASLGLYYDHSHTGPGMKVLDYLKTGPAGRTTSQLRPGAVILAIDGQEIGKDSDIYPLLNHKAGTPVQLTLRTADGKETAETITPCTAHEAITVHAHHRWIQFCKDTTERLSKGRLGFVHVAMMMTPNYEIFYRELFNEDMSRKEGVLVDIRFNGGGNLSEQLIATLSADFAGTQVDRNNNYLGDVPSSRWWKPTALLANTWSYSDGSIFPHLYKSSKLGKFVGSPVPGTGTSVWQIKLFNDKLIYTLPELGRKDPDGNYFERQQDEPDVLVHNTPDSLEEGRDLQLEAAVKALLEQLDK